MTKVSLVNVVISQLFLTLSNFESVKIIHNLAKKLCILQIKIWFHKIEGAYKANAACTLICRPQTYICLKGSTGKSCVLSVFICRLVMKRRENRMKIIVRETYV